MIARRARIVLAALAASILAVAGCAVPGQGGPGVAATYNGVEYNYTEVAKFEAAFAGLRVQPDAGRALTFALLGDVLVPAAEENGFVYTDDQALADLATWDALATGDGPTSAEAISVARTTRALEFMLSTSAESVDALVAVVVDLEAGVEASPRMGAFTQERFISSLSAAVNAYTTQGANLGPALFTVFAQVTGFAAAAPDWIQGD